MRHHEGSNTVGRIVVSIALVLMTGCQRCYGRRAFLDHINGELVGSGTLQNNITDLKTCKAHCGEDCLGVNYCRDVKQCWHLNASSICEAARQQEGCVNVPKVICFAGEKGSDGELQAGIADVISCIGGCNGSCRAVDWNADSNSCRFFSEDAACEALTTDKHFSFFRKTKCEVDEAKDSSGTLATRTKPVSETDGISFANVDSAFHNLPEDIQPYPNAIMPGGELHDEFKSLSACLQACVAPCVSIDYDYYVQECWFHEADSACGNFELCGDGCAHFIINYVCDDGTMDYSGPLAYPACGHNQIAPSLSLREAPSRRRKRNAYWGMGKNVEVAAEHQRVMREYARRAVEQLEARIVGGTEAVPGSWPWQVAVIWISGNKGSLCGGSLVSSKHVITAAHCVVNDRNLANYFITLGNHALEDNDPSVIRLQPAEIQIHPYYSKGQFGNDIAIITLSRPVQFTATISPICLPSLDQDFPAGTKCVVTGWGSTKLGANSQKNSGGVSQVLNQVEVIIQPQLNCFIQYQNSIYPSMICAGSATGGKDACMGDSGGPLACKVGNAFYLAGAVSFGVACGSAIPGVYTRVSSYSDWINATMSGN